MTDKIDNERLRAVEDRTLIMETHYEQIEKIQDRIFAKLSEIAEGKTAMCLRHSDTLLILAGRVKDEEDKTTDYGVLQEKVKGLNARVIGLFAVCGALALALGYGYVKHMYS